MRERKREEMRVGRGGRQKKSEEAGAGLRDKDSWRERGGETYR